MGATSRVPSACAPLRASTAIHAAARGPGDEAGRQGGRYSNANTGGAASGCREGLSLACRGLGALIFACRRRGCWPLQLQAWGSWHLAPVATPHAFQSRPARAAAQRSSLSGWAEAIQGLRSCGSCPRRTRAGTLSSGEAGGRYRGLRGCLGIGGGPPGGQQRRGPRARTPRRAPPAAAAACRRLRRLPPLPPTSRLPPLPPLQPAADVLPRNPHTALRRRPGCD